MGNGLEIMLDIQQDEYLPIWRETSKSQETFVYYRVGVKAHVLLFIFIPLSATYTVK